MGNLYGWLQWSMWGLLYCGMAIAVYNRPIFVETELFYGAVLVGVTALGSHLLRGFYRTRAASYSVAKQVITLVAGSVLFAALAAALLLLAVFTLSASGVSFPIPADQRWFVIKTVFSGNFINMLLALLLWSAVYFAVTKVRQLRQTTALLKQTQLDTLINQLNPHFLFNAINNIRALILEDTERSRAMLAALSDMLRYNLDSQQGIKVTLAQELSIVLRYIELCSIQYEHRLSYQQQIEPQCEAMLLPKFLLQLCVENALKHGISKLEHGGSVTVTANATDNCLRLQIRHPGTLAPAYSEAKGVGVKNIKQRLQLLYHGHASFSLEQQAGSVVTQICLPVEY